MGRVEDLYKKKTGARTVSFDSARSLSTEKERVETYRSESTSAASPNNSPAKSKQTQNYNHGYENSGLSRNAYDSSVRSAYAERNGAKKPAQTVNFTEAARSLANAAPNSLAAEEYRRQTEKAGRQMAEEQLARKAAAEAEERDSKVRAAYAERKKQEAISDMHLKRMAYNEVGKDALNQYLATGKTPTFSTKEETERYAELLNMARDWYMGSQYKTTANGKTRDWISILLDDYSESSFDDPLYDAINGNKDAQAVLTNQAMQMYAGSGALGGVMATTENESQTQQMTPDEIAMFNYIYANAGKEAAHEYYYNIRSDLNYRQRMADEAYWRQYAQEHPVESSAFSVLASPLKGLSYIGQTADYIGSGAIDQNAPYNKFSYTPSSIRGEVSDIVKEKWGGVGSFAYQTGMSMGDFLLTAAMSGGEEALALTIMGSGAAADTVIAKKDAGYDDNRAYILGTAAGVVEAATEKIGFDALFKSGLLKQGKAGFAKYILRNMGAEGAEEGASDILNWTLDGLYDLVTGVKDSEWTRRVRELQKQGHSESEAAGIAFAEHMEELGLDVLGGAVSGGIMGGAGGGANIAINTNQIGAEFNAMGEDVVNATIETGLESDSSTRSYQLAQKLKQKQDAGKSIGNMELGRLYQANVQAIDAEDAVEQNNTASDTEADVDNYLLAEGEIQIDPEKTISGAIGYDGEGRPIYQNNFPEGTTKTQKKNFLYNLVRKVWSKKPITLTITENGKQKQIKAQFSDDGGPYSSAEHIARGSRNSTRSENKVKNSIANDLYSLTESAKYDSSKVESGKGYHLDALRWHYFVNEFIYNNKPYSVLIDVKETPAGDYVYNYTVRKMETQNIAASPRGAEVVQTSPSPISNIAQQEAPVNQAGDGLGAADAGFTQNEGPQVPTQNKTVTQNPFLTDFEKTLLSPNTHERVSEQESVRRAERNFYADENGNIVNLDETVQELLDKETWSGTDQDTAQLAQAELIKEARQSGDWSKVQELAKAIEKQGTEAGRSLQARKKWAESGAGIVSQASEALETAKDGTDTNAVLDTIAEFADRFDAAKLEGNVRELANIIRETSKIRRTGSLFTNELSKAMNKAIDRVVAQNDVEFLQNLAANGLVAIAEDQQSIKVSDAIKTIRRNAMLSKFNTIMRNLVSNNVFDPLDSVSRNMSVPLDMLLSKYTGTRGVTWDRSWASAAKRQGSIDGAARAMIEVGLDLDGSTSKYEGSSNRTFKMTGGTFSRLMSSWEKWMGYMLNVTDEFQKGGISAEIQRGINELYEKGLITDPSLENAGATEALYRTFQDETALSNFSINMRRALNHLAFGGVGVGDVALPFAQVPANLASRALEYSPLGLAKSLGDLAKVLKNAKNGTLTAAQQAKAVQAFGRGVNGTALIALAVAAAAKNLLKVLGSGSNDGEKNKAALDKQSGMYGTQINLDAIIRWANGESTEWRDGDTLMNIGFLDPLNAQLTTGALIAEDIKNENAGVVSVLKDSLDGTIQSVMEMPVMSVFADVADAYRYSGAETEGGKVVDAALSFGAGQVSSMIPNALRGIAQGTDEYQRDAYSSGSLAGEVWDNIKASVPGARQTLPAKQDSFGNDMKNSGGVLNFLNSNILPGQLNTYRTTELTEALNKLYDETGRASILPERKAPNKVSSEGESFALTAGEKRKFQETQGSVYESAANVLLKKGSKLDSGDMADVLEDIKAYAREKAKDEFLVKKGAEITAEGDFAKLKDTPLFAAVDYFLAKDAMRDVTGEKAEPNSSDYVMLDAITEAFPNMPKSSKDAISQISGMPKLVKAKSAGIGSEDWYEFTSQWSGSVSQKKIIQAVKDMGWSNKKGEAAYNVFRESNGWKKTYWEAKAGK